MTTTYSITRNPQYDSYEVTFDSKPATAVLDALKNLKMRWNHKKGCWYGFAAEHEIVDAILSNSQDGETITGEKTEGATVYTDGYLGGGAVYESKSNLGLYGTDLSKAIRENLKAAGIKGVTISNNHGSITATIKTTMADLVPEDAFTDAYIERGGHGWVNYFDSHGIERCIEYCDYCNLPFEEREAIRIDNAHREYKGTYTRPCSLNEYYLERYSGFSESGMARIQKVFSIITAYRYDRSNGMVDYFDTNFYITIHTKPAFPEQ